MTVLRLLQRQFDRLFAFDCQLCGKPAASDFELCEDCELDLPWLVNGCSLCCRPLPVGSGNEICGHCIDKTPVYSHAEVLFSYQGEVRERIAAMKFHRDTAATRLFGDLMARAAANRFANVDCVVPVPLHTSRQRQRGYNQSLELSRIIAQKSAWNVDHRLLKKAKKTLPQTGLSAASRVRNLKGAFVASEAAKGKKILLIDDVITTDSTVSECAKALLNKGAKEVSVLAIARA